MKLFCWIIHVEAVLQTKKDNQPLRAPKHTEYFLDIISFISVIFGGLGG